MAIAHLPPSGTTLRGASAKARLWVTSDELLARRSTSMAGSGSTRNGDGIMTYGIYAPCNACAKVALCSDLPRIQDAVRDIHNAGPGHKGGGTIAIQCTNLQPLMEYNPGGAEEST